MTLSEYIALRGKRVKRELHEKTGLRWATVHDVARGAVTPTVRTAQLIEEATGGLVTAAEILGIEAA